MVHNRLGLKIHRIKRSYGSQVETRGEIEEEITSYFEGIINEDYNDKERDIAWITALIPRTVTKEDNEMLNKPISVGAHTPCLGNPAVN